MVPVTDLIASLDDPARAVLEGCRVRALELVPESVEGVSYGMPALLYRGKGLVAVAVTKAGYSLYPFSGQVITAIAPELGDIARSKGAVQFTDARPLPPAAFDALVLARRAEIDGQSSASRGET
ncbi:MAG: hypothetical protein C0444_07370 [Microbacterium sp.]|nr:hypothetical protein [Microbacterium sp.]MBA4345431.1 hypothetical protein [Microbacterium sp.]